MNEDNHDNTSSTTKHQESLVLLPPPPPDQELLWKDLNVEAERLARLESPAPLPPLHHLTSKDFEHVYEPAADTYLLLDTLQYELREGTLFHYQQSGSRKQEHQSLQGEEYDDCTSPTIALEIGCGSGVPSIFLHTNWMNNNNEDTLLSIVTDINPHALDVAQRTAKEAGIVTTCFEAIQCDLATVLLPRLYQSVTILLFNPPYVPTPDSEIQGNGIEISWAGGYNGRRIIDRCIPYIHSLLHPQYGVAYMITVDDNQPYELFQQLQSMGLLMQPLLRRRAYNEFLTVQKITPL